ncbi:ATP-binding protein [Empedobacter brevis]|uniref:AAA family ATPase n=1 Tax=Empedobacter brevis TaxID=247 RepID=UPI00123D5EF6|nr:AAA family ATPase [Empedobacter brevis]QES92228.1 ATP-binding protein [Empedobacter brevis]
MEIEIPENKIYNQSQSLTLDSSVMTFVGENGCGKSAILESIFSKYLYDTDSETQLVAFSSGNNESFSSIFQNNFRNIKKLVVDDLNYTEEDENEESASERIEKVINTMYFDPTWVRFLVFCASSLKRDGKVIEFLKEKDLVDVDEHGVDITTHIGFPFRIRTYYNTQIIRARDEEAINPNHKSIRRTFLHQYLTKIAEHLSQDYHFDIEEEGARIVKTWKWFYAKDLPIVLGNDSFKIFSFLAWASLNNDFIFRHDCVLRFKNNIELNHLSDGEHQLLAIYSLIDLFDSDNTLYLLDEVDSHLYYKNIEKLWNVFGAISGKVITTTHSADSIILNEFSNIKLIEKGKIENEIVANKILDRLESLSAGGNYKLSVAGKVKYLALVEDYFDWFIFIELCKKKVPDFDLNTLQQIHYIKCSSGYQNSSQRFGNSKLDWVESFKREHSSPNTKTIFLICDRDNLSAADIRDNGLVVNSAPAGRNNTINLRGAGNKTAYLMSWKRREIENYLLSFTLLSAHGKLDEINNHLAPVNQLVINNTCDNDDVRNLDVKTMLQPLYLKDGYATMPTDESGVDYNKLSSIIAQIPESEISEDILNVYNFIIGKI